MTIKEIKEEVMGQPWGPPPRLKRAKYGSNEVPKGSMMLTSRGNVTSLIIS